MNCKALAFGNVAMVMPVVRLVNVSGPAGHAADSQPAARLSVTEMVLVVAARGMETSCDWLSERVKLLTPVAAPLGEDAVNWKFSGSPSGVVCLMIRTHPCTARPVKVASTGPLKHLESGFGIMLPALHA